MKLFLDMLMVFMYYCATRYHRLKIIVKNIYVDLLNEAKLMKTSTLGCGAQATSMLQNKST